MSCFLQKVACKKKLDSKKPTDAKKKLDSKEPPYVTSKEPPNVIEMCTMESLWTDVHYGITMESAVSFKIDVNSLSCFNYIMGGGEKKEDSPKMWHKDQKVFYKTGGGVKYDYVIFKCSLMFPHEVQNLLIIFKKCSTRNLFRN